MSENSIKKRMSNFELLRIISVIMIIAHHYSVHGNWIDKINGISVNNIILDFLAIGGKIGVTCFVLITGYFGVNSNFNIKKIIKLILQVLFYSILFWVIFNIVKFKEVDYTFKLLVRSFFPITFSLYWFATTYIILYLFSPFLNKLITTLSKNELKAIILILILLCYIIPTFTTSNLDLSNQILFILWYIIGGYIKIHCTKFNFKHNGWICFFIIYILILLSQLILENLASRYDIFKNQINYFIGLNKLPIFLCSILLFIIFKDLKIENKIINKFASASFGIYLIHDNYFVRIFLWQITLKNNDYYFSNYLWLHAIISIVFVFISSLLIEFIRLKIIEKKLLTITYYIYDKIQMRIRKTKIYKKLSEM